MLQMSALCAFCVVVIVRVIFLLILRLLRGCSIKIDKSVSEINGGPSVSLAPGVGASITLQRRSFPVRRLKDSLKECSVSIAPLSASNGTIRSDNEALSL